MVILAALSLPSGTVSSFQDSASISPWPSRPWAAGAAGLFGGDTSGNLNPGGFTRGEAAAVFCPCWSGFDPLKLGRGVPRRPQRFPSCIGEASCYNRLEKQKCGSLRRTTGNLRRC